MCETRRLTTLLASKALCKDRFTLYPCPFVEVSDVVGVCGGKIPSILDRGIEWEKKWSGERSSHFTHEKMCRRRRGSPAVCSEAVENK
jgi:hypothetical protein